MPIDNAAQVGTKQEDTQMQFIQTMVTFLQDAAHLPELRREAERLRTEVESLKHRNEELNIELSLEREAHAKSLDGSQEWKTKASLLASKLTSLQHKFDTINGVVMAAMAEIERDKPKPVIEVVKEEPKPWTPSSPISSVGY